MASIIRKLSTVSVDRSRVDNSRVANEAETGTAKMSLSDGDEQLIVSSENFWEVGNFMRTVTRIDNGYKLCSNLKQLILSRAEIEQAYAKQLTQWSKKWNEFLDKGPEYGTTLAAWHGLLEEADSLSDLHNEVGNKLVNSVTVSIKKWQKENYQKSMMHFKKTKEMEDQFRKAQKPWGKMLNKVMLAKKDYHNACRSEKSTANQESNVRADTAFSSDQLKKLQEKLKKCQLDVETTSEKYNACLNDLNGYNSKYIEDMTEVFDKCQDFEAKRIEFFKTIMFEIHHCLDLSVDARYTQVYTDLHQSISKTDKDKDLQWWSSTYGTDMVMAWPVFEEYSPDLKPIHGKEKKSQISSNEGCITITNIKLKEDGYVQPTTAPCVTNNRNSQNSLQSAGTTNPMIINTTENQNIRQNLYDKSLNLFDVDDTHDAKDEKFYVDAIIKSISNAPAAVVTSFGDARLNIDKNASDGGSYKKELVTAVHARVLYAYQAEEEDEINAEPGDVITRLSDQDDMGWVKAIGKDGKEGLIPFSYVVDI